MWSEQGRYYPAMLVSSDPSGLNYEILVPPNSGLRLAIEGFGVRVLDSTGAPVNFAVPSAAIQSKSNESDQVRRYQVAK